MGFFDSIISPILEFAAPIVGALGGPVAGVATAALGGALAADPTAIAPAGAVGLATGSMRKQTIVQTIDANGKVVKQKISKGGVAVFQADVTAANRVARQIRRLDKRMPKKIVKQSETARLTEEVKNAALRHARDVSEHHQIPPPRC